MREARAVDSRFWTTRDVAQWLERTPRGTRWIVDQAQVPCERVRGQRLFRPDDVKQLAHQRAEARRTGVTVLRPKRLGVRGEPHQLSLFGARVRHFPARECHKVSLPDAEVHHAELFRKVSGS